MKWFMHQSQAHRDTKLKKVLIRYGAEGYGLYWFCIEHICADVDPKLTFELEHDAEILAYELKIDTLKVQEMLVYMVHLGLFEISDNIIYCMKLARYLGDKNTRNDDLKEIIQQQKAALSRTVPDSPRQSALEERRGEEIRGEISPKGDIAPKRAKNTPFREIVDLYHKHCSALPGVVELTDSRKASVRARHNGIMERDLSNWDGYFKSVSRSDFLMGRKKDWKADFDFLIRAKTPTKVLEGSYQ